MVGNQENEIGVPESEAGDRDETEVGFRLSDSGLGFGFWCLNCSRRNRDSAAASAAMARPEASWKLYHFPGEGRGRRPRRLSGRCQRLAS